MWVRRSPSPAVRRCGNLIRLMGTWRRHLKRTPPWLATGPSVITWMPSAHACAPRWRNYADAVGLACGITVQPDVRRDGLAAASAFRAAGRDRPCGGRGVGAFLLFCLIGTFLPYSTVQIGIRTTVSEALIMLTWGSYLLQAMFQEQVRVPGMLRTEKLLVALMLFSAFPFLVGQLTVVAEGNGPINWVRWLFNLSILFLVPRLLTDSKNLENAVMALLGGTLLMLLLSISLYVAKGTATAIIPILGSLGYSGADTLTQSCNRFPAAWARRGCTPTWRAVRWRCCCRWRSASA